MRALVPAVRGEMPILVDANASADITSALEWAEKRGLTDQIILSGAAEGWRVADEIAEAGVPVLAGPVLSTPSRDSDRFDKAYANPGLMREAGVQVAIRTGESENVRNLPYHAGFAAAYGMGKEEALRAVTIVPAEIFGVDDEVGSLEAGKRANLFVATGDPFETKTDIVHLFIDGYNVPVESRHTKLYDEFLQRTPGVEK
jgi:imidazolonepropionase-like amidohydrolase